MSSTNHTPLPESASSAPRSAPNPCRRSTRSRRDSKITWSRVAIVLTVLFWAIYVVTTIIRQFIDNGSQNFRFTMEAIGYTGRRHLPHLLRADVPGGPAGSALSVPEARRAFRGPSSTGTSPTHQPSITVLVPSYAEEPEVVRDDAAVGRAAGVPRPARRAAARRPAEPDRPGRARAARRDPRASPDEIEAMLRRAARSASPTRSCGTSSAERDAGRRCDRRGTLASSPVDYAGRPRLARSDHGRRRARSTTTSTSSSSTRCCGARPTTCALTGEAAARGHRRGRLPDVRARARSCTAASRGPSTPSSTCFERKKYASLSHEANKAMNLNAYIGLMGGTLPRRGDAGRPDPARGRRRAPAGDLVDPGQRLPADPRRRLACCCASTACGSSTSCEQPGQRAGRRHPDAVLVVPRRAAPASSASPVRPPTSSTSCTRA